MARLDLLIGPRQYQKYMQHAGRYKGAIDGIIGKQSIAATHDMISRDDWNVQRKADAIVQLLLNELGLYAGSIDGLVGPKTKMALHKYIDLIDHKVEEPDEISQTVVMDFQGKAKPLDSVDIGLIGRRIGVGEDEIHAVLDVETRGGGFDKKGRPKMLFEPHIFYRELAGAERQRAVQAGLAYPRWRRNYPSDSYPRLHKALEINRNAAFRSASWGLGQVMGFNCKLADYETAEAMVADFLDDEQTHLEAMIAFIVNIGLDDELRRHDWRGFARGYNGAGFEKNNYHTKLAKRYSWWQTKPDTPLPKSLAL